MAASLSVIAMQVDFAYVLAMEHTGMVRMFKALEETGLKGFFECWLEGKLGTGFVPLIAMVHSPSRQSQGFGVQLSVLLKRSVKEYLGEAVKLHPQKVLNNKSVHTYMKKNLGVGPAGETSKVSGTTASEQQSTADSLQSLTKKPKKEASEMKKTEKAAAEKKKKNNKEKIFSVVVKKIVEARSQATSRKSKSEISSYADSRPLAKLKKCGVAPKRKMVVESLDSESTVSLPIVQITKKQRTQRKKQVKKIVGDQTDSNAGSVMEIPAVADDASTVGAPEDNLEKNPEVERQDDDQGAHVKCTDKTEIETVTNEGAIVVRSGPEQPAQQPMTSTGKDPAAKGKEIMDAFSRLNPVEKHCMLVLKSAWEDVSNKMFDYDKWVHFHTAVRLNAVSSITPIETKQPAQREGKIEEIVRTVEDVEETEAMNSQEHQAQGNGQQAQAKERQAQGGEHQAHSEPNLETEQEDERRAQTG
ncbi:hypothetical protein F511_30081 [Dorcoceras hygrometricum]|uniref:Uncharacterized protein n=1 Tax=Dorcoceras hygrometricum TaxID=472368 RepID=A0A2Z7AX67_9LAMI|nr:hypothetical protein F511_30081 [Dorcoceras hygrometricum]